MQTQLGELSVDLNRCEVRRPARRPQRLTRNEVKILGVLLEKSNQTVWREELLERALGYRANVPTRALSHAIIRLRQKIEIDPRRPRYLKTVYGCGYRLETSAE